MPAPKPTRLFHITAIANLPAILAAGALLSKNAGAAVGIDYQNIARDARTRFIPICARFRRSIAPKGAMQPCMSNVLDGRLVFSAQAY